MSLSVCMIVRDEERFLPACLESLRGVADEVVVVDTGSTDSTVAIAERLGARVLHYAWNDDFAAARNRALEASTGAWVLTLDADERLDPQSAGRIGEAVIQGGFDIGLLPFVNMNGDLPCGREWLSCRLFRRTPQMRYVGRIHEQLIQQIPETRTRVVQALVYHYGYQTSVFAEKQKQGRNARLIELALRESETQGPLMRSNYLYHYANLASGKELIWRYDEFGDYVRAQWPERLPQVPWVIAGLAEYARLLNDVGRYSDSGSLAKELLVRYGESPALHYLVARARAAEGCLDAAESEIHMVLDANASMSDDHRMYSQDLGMIRGRAQFLLGLIREKQQRLEECIPRYRAAVREEPDEGIFRARLACALARLGCYQEALRALEGSPTLVGGAEPGVACLGFALSLLTQSVARLGLWGEKMRQAATQYAPAAIIVEKVKQFGAYHEYQMEDFPEISRGLELLEEPGSFEMPQTTRRSR